MKTSLKSLIIASAATVALAFSTGSLAGDRDHRDYRDGGKHRAEHYPRYDRRDSHRRDYDRQYYGKKYYRDHDRGYYAYNYRNGPKWKHYNSHKKHYKHHRGYDDRYYYRNHHRHGRVNYHYHDNDDVYAWIGGMYILNEILHHNH